MSFSVFLGNKIIDAVRGTNYSASALYLALHTADPGTTGWPVSNEVSGSSYARQAIILTAASNKSSLNESIISFAGMPAGNVTYASLTNWVTAGSLLMSGSLSASKVCNAGDTFQFSASAITVNLT